MQGPVGSAKCRSRRTSGRGVVSEGGPGSQAVLPAPGKEEGFPLIFQVTLPLHFSAKAGCREGRFLPASRSFAVSYFGSQEMMQQLQWRWGFGDGASAGDSAGGCSTADLFEVRKVEIIETAAGIMFSLLNSNIYSGAFILGSEGAKG